MKKMLSAIFLFFCAAIPLCALSGCAQIIALQEGVYAAYDIELNESITFDYLKIEIIYGDGAELAAAVSFIRNGGETENAESSLTYYKKELHVAFEIDAETVYLNGKTKQKNNGIYIDGSLTCGSYSVSVRLNGLF